MADDESVVSRFFLIIYSLYAVNTGKEMLYIVKEGSNQYGVTGPDGALRRDKGGWRV